MGYISNIFIKNLIYSTDIIKVISSKIPLKRVGTRYKTFCPFHKENNPSFVVDEDKKFYYCFGCKAYGNVIDFLMNFCNINFIDSIKELAVINGVDLVFSGTNDNKYSNNLSEKYCLSKLNLEIGCFYHSSLIYNEKLNFVRLFLFKRGLNICLIKRFFIGYSSIELFKKWINSIESSKIEVFIKYGVLVKDKKGNIYDRLYNRIIFPIYNLYNEIIAFGGRILNCNYYSKYINSTCNFFFSKKKNLYGLNLIDKNSKINKILVVEGYMDVISLHKFGINYTVGLLGSSISSYQIKILYRYTNKIFFCYDGDISGLKSCESTIFLILNYISEIKKSFFIFLPNKEDPDSLIHKEGVNKFLDRINNSLSIFKALFKLFFLKYGLLLTDEKKIFFWKKIFYFVSKIRSPFIKFFIRRKILASIGIEEYNLRNFLNFKFKCSKRKNTILRCLISLLIKHTELSNLVNVYDKLFNINIPGLFFFLNLVILCINNKNMNFYELIKYKINSKYRLYLEYLFFWDFLIPNGDYKKVFLSLLNRLKIFIIDKKLSRLILRDKIFGLNLKEKKIVWNLIKLKNLYKV